MIGGEIDQEIASIEKNSSEALSLIAKSGRKLSKTDRVCWHLRPLGNPDEEDDEYFDRIQQALSDDFPEMTLTWAGLGSFELWEVALPERNWLHERLGQLREFCGKTDTCPEGWSYEPTDRLTSWIPQAWADDEEGRD